MTKNQARELIQNKVDELFANQDMAQVVAVAAGVQTKKEMRIFCEKEDRTGQWRSQVHF